MFWLLMFCVWAFIWAVTIGAFGWIALPLLIIGSLTAGVIVQEA